MKRIFGALAVKRISLRSRAVLLCVAYRAAFALAVGLVPAVATARLTGAHPRGDAVLWDRGGLLLVETARLLVSHRGELVTPAVVLLVLAVIGWALPLGALIASCGSEPPRDLSDALGHGARAIGRLTLLAALALLAEALLATLTTALCGFGARPFLAPEAHSTPWLVGGAFGLVLAWGGAVLADLARAQIVYDERGTLAAIACAWRWLWSDWRLLGAAGWRTIAGAFGLLLAGRIVLAANPRMPALAIALALASGAIPIALRASWFSALARHGSSPASPALAGRSRRALEEQGDRLVASRNSRFSPI